MALDYSKWENVGETEMMEETKEFFETIAEAHKRTVLYDEYMRTEKSDPKGPPLALPSDLEKLAEPVSAKEPVVSKKKEPVAVKKNVVEKKKKKKAPEQKVAETPVETKEAPMSGPETNEENLGNLPDEEKRRILRAHKKVGILDPSVEQFQSLVDGLHQLRERSAFLEREAKASVEEARAKFKLQKGLLQAFDTNDNNKETLLTAREKADAEKDIDDDLNLAFEKAGLKDLFKGDPLPFSSQQDDDDNLSTTTADRR